MNKVVIKVWRGMVSEVYASDPDTDITVIDEDCGEYGDEDCDEDRGEAEEIELPEHQVYSV